MELITLPERLDAAQIGALAERVRASRKPGSKAAGLGFAGACDGLDLEALVAAHFSPEVAPLDAFAILIEAIAADPRPVVFAAQGALRGGGVAFAAVADVVIAHPSASFGLPEVFWGLVPATVLAPLTRRVGPVAARRMALGAAAIDAHEARRIGLVDEVADDPFAAATAWGLRWAKADPRALATVKALTRGAVDAAAARGACRTLLATEETRRRLRALVAGQVPWDEAGGEP